MKQKILFIGGTLRGLRLIESLVDANEEIVQAFILDEDEHEPIKVSKEIAALCGSKNIEYRICKKIENGEIESILSRKPDVSFVCGWRSVIDRDLYEKIPNGCLAAHDSLLPRNRGFAPTAWAIINGENKTGVTLFKIDDKGVDAGDIFGQKEIVIDDRESSEDIYPRIIESTVQLYTEYLEARKNGPVELSKQEESEATYNKKRSPEDGEIPWSRTAEDINNLIRALTPPYPYAWFIFKEKKYFVIRAHVAGAEKQSKKVPGEIISVEDGLVVSCLDGSINISNISDKTGGSVAIGEVFHPGEIIKNKEGS